MTSRRTNMKHKLYASVRFMCRVCTYTPMFIYIHIGLRYKYNTYIAAENSALKSLDNIRRSEMLACGMQKLHAAKEFDQHKGWDGHLTHRMPAVSIGD